MLRPSLFSETDCGVPGDAAGVTAAAHPARDLPADRYPDPQTGRAGSPIGQASETYPPTDTPTRMLRNSRKLRLHAMTTATTAVATLAPMNSKGTF